MPIRHKILKFLFWEFPYRFPSTCLHVPLASSSVPMPSSGDDPDRSSVSPSSISWSLDKHKKRLDMDLSIIPLLREEMKVVVDGGNDSSIAPGD